jgi:suppressor of ftsI
MALILALGALTSGCTSASSESSTMSSPSPSTSFAAGAPLREPAQLVSHDGLLRAGIAVERRRVNLTNMHVHGLHVSPSGDADNVFLHLRPGQTFHYAFEFPRTLRAGTYWYHPRPPLTSAAQVAGGMSGIVIVDGLQQYLPADLRHITEQVIALKDFQLQGDVIKTDHEDRGMMPRPSAGGRRASPVVSSKLAEAGPVR